MAKTKADWIVEAKALGIKVTTKDKIADIRAAIEDATTEGVVDEKLPEVTKEKNVAKAGKRSAKTIREDEEEAARLKRIKTEKEVEKAEDHEEKKGPTPVTRPLIERRSKRYQELAKLIDKDKVYSLAEAVPLAIKSSKVNFDPSIELHVSLNVDPKQADQNVRGVLVLPHGTGKSVRVAVFATADMHTKAKEAGADIVGEEAFLDLLKKEELDFDVLVSTPQLMAQLGQYARLLGPKGLMPNPKSGTVTKDIVKTVKRLKAGQLEYRVDDMGIIHTVAGKISFGEAKLLENMQLLLNSIKQAKPASLKSSYVEKIYITTSMGPSIKVDVSTAFSE